MGGGGEREEEFGGIIIANKRKRSGGGKRGGRGGGAEKNGKLRGTSGKGRGMVWECFWDGRVQLGKGMDDGLGRLSHPPPPGGWL